MWLLDIPDTCVARDSEEAPEVEENNLRFQELRKSRIGSEKYVARSMQTFNNALKTKQNQTFPVNHQSIDVQTSVSTIYDSFQSQAPQVPLPDDEDREDLALPSAEPSGFSGGSIAESTIGGSTWSSMSTSMAVGPMMPTFSSMEMPPTQLQKQTAEAKSGEGNEDQERQDEKDDQPILLTDHPFFKAKGAALVNSLLMMERRKGFDKHRTAFANFRYSHKLQQDLENLREFLPEMSQKVAARLRQKYQPIVKESFECTSAPYLKKLWVMNSNLTKGYSVCCLSWNRAEGVEVLAAGYGSFEFKQQKEGFVCCWPLNNCEHPERVYRLPCTVTSLAFSKTHPSLLAVGLYDGSISIFNIREHSAEAVMSNSETSTKHCAPVWKVQWVGPDEDGGGDADETLVSISSDGRVVRWSVFKGFECHDLMRLRRATKKLPEGSRHTLHQTANVGRTKTEGLIQRNASGFCLDFQPGNSNVYVVGTEEGYLHRCSCSYNEQYLETYISHISGVYGVSWSPFNNRQFLSCSADWTVCLWDIDQSEPINKFESCRKAVQALAWSPIIPDVFACVGHGRIEIWDLKEGNHLDPVIVHEPSTLSLQTSVVFAQSAQAVFVGDADGQITVYEICGLPSFFKLAQSVIEADKQQAIEDAIAEVEGEY